MDIEDNALESLKSDQKREGEGAGSHQSHGVRRSLSEGGLESLARKQEQSHHNN